MALRERLKWLLFPGLNLHARLRYQVLPTFFGHADREHDRLVLDAGCGNGMLTYQSWRRGNRVIGVSIKNDEAERCRKLFNRHLAIDEARLSFQVRNLYDIEGLGLLFDEIICSEVLEHIVRDGDVCRSFWRMLKPGGVLHLCCPNADHPDNAASPLDPNESGGHVRPGYTTESYRGLLEPIGFRLLGTVGIGGPIREFFNHRMIALQQAGHYAVAATLFLIAWPLLWLDASTPRVPYSIYVRAVKPTS